MTENKTLETQLNRIVRIKVADLLKKQILDGEFNRYDIIVRLISVEEYLKDDNYNFKLYKKMQHKRMRADPARCHEYITQFKTLIKSIHDHGFEEGCPILIGNTLHIIDGSHRMACCLHYNVQYITAKVHERDMYAPYNIKWFHDNLFTFKEIKKINKRWEELKEKYGV